MYCRGIIESFASHRNVYKPIDVVRGIASCICVKYNKKSTQEINFIFLYTYLYQYK